MVDKTKKVWMDGELVDWDSASFPVLTHSFHYGVAAFEGVRAYKRADGRTSVFRLDAHTDRLFDTCKLAFLEPKFTKAQINEGHLALARANGMDEAYFRPMVYVADGAMGIYAPNNEHRSMIVAWKWGAYLGADALAAGIRCKISSWHRHHIGVGLPKAKMTGQYTNSVLAKREAKLGGYDEAILTDVNGLVSEGSGENLFIVKKGKLITPPLSGSVLAGITRDTILTLAREDGIPVVETPITRDELYLADEAFFTGTAAEVTPIREVDDRKVGVGKPGEITVALQKRYFDAVKGVSTAHPEWHTFVLFSPAWRPSPPLPAPPPRRSRRGSLRRPALPPRPFARREQRRAGRAASGARSTASVSTCGCRCRTGGRGASTTTRAAGSRPRTRPRARPCGCGCSSRATRRTVRSAKHGCAKPISVCPSPRPISRWTTPRRASSRGGTRGPSRSSWPMPPQHRSSRDICWCSLRTSGNASPFSSPPRPRALPRRKSSRHGSSTRKSASSVICASTKISAHPAAKS